jgi:glycosyltransferase involved in cell wall biosynthesis
VNDCAASEIVQHEVNGYLVDDEQAMAAAIADLHQIDPAVCRESVATRFSPRTVAAGYVEISRRSDQWPTSRGCPRSLSLAGLQSIKP